MASQIHLCEIVSAEFTNTTKSSVQIKLKSKDDGQDFVFRMALSNSHPSHVSASKRQIQYFLNHTDSGILSDDTLAELVGRKCLIKYKGLKMGASGFKFKALDTLTDDQWVKEAKRRKLDCGE